MTLVQYLSPNGVYDWWSREGYKRALRHLAAEFLNVEIQNGEHCPVSGLNLWCLSLDLYFVWKFLQQRWLFHFLLKIFDEPKVFFSDRSYNMLFTSLGNFCFPCLAISWSLSFSSIVAATIYLYNSSSKLWFWWIFLFF